MKRKISDLLEKLLLFFADNMPAIFAAVFIFSFLFTTFFGNYPQWQEEEYDQSLKQFFEPQLENVVYEWMLTSEPTIKLIFSYSDGTDLSLTNFKRTNRQSIAHRWKEDILNLVCVHEDLRGQLQKGRKIEIDLRDGDSHNGVGIITNMVINNERC